MAKKQTAKKVEESKLEPMATLMIVPKEILVYGKLAKRLWPMRFK
jgi:hypothetical protein